METNISEVLAERGSRYGEFKRHAAITMQLKTVVREYDDLLNDPQREALDMIMHKVGRILNGDPNYVDSWVDIAGYAKLIADQLNKDQQNAVEEKFGKCVGGATPCTPPFGNLYYASSTMDGPIGK